MSNDNDPPHGYEGPPLIIPVELTQIAPRTQRIAPFRVVEGPSLTIISSSVPGGPIRAVTMPDGAVYWEDKDPVEFEREYAKIMEKWS